MSPHKYISSDVLKSINCIARAYSLSRAQACEFCFLKLTRSIVDAYLETDQKGWDGNMYKLATSNVLWYWWTPYLFPSCAFPFNWTALSQPSSLAWSCMRSHLSNLSHLAFCLSSTSIMLLHFLFLLMAISFSPMWIAHHSAQLYPYCMFPLSVWTIAPPLCYMACITWSLAVHTQVLCKDTEFLSVLLGGQPYDEKLVRLKSHRESKRRDYWAGKVQN